MTVKCLQRMESGTGIYAANETIRKQISYLVEGCLMCVGLAVVVDVFVDSDQVFGFEMKFGR